MATIARSFEAAVTDGTLNAASVTTGTTSALIDLTSYEGAHNSITADFPGSPTDNLVVEVFATNDGGTTYDLTPLHSFTIDKATDPNRLSFIVERVAGYQVKAKRSGSTDTITVTLKSRRYQWTVS